MKPELKAKELVEKYVNKDFALRFAIAVEDSHIFLAEFEKAEYWQQVKTEIEKL